jgi:broad specificity phosphatase PhoE
MTRIYLIRHASPRVEPGVPASQWHLSPQGIEEAHLLAEIARTWQIAALYCSVEPKAQTTAAIIADAVGLPVHVAEGFEEQRWDEWIENADAFNDAVRRILEQPEDRLNGSEPASSAAARFDAALRSVAADVPTDAPLRSAAADALSGIPLRPVGTTAAADPPLRPTTPDAPTLAVVSHGRVLTAWLAQAIGIESPFDAWRAMPMPAYCGIELTTEGRARLVEPFRGLASTTP